jgi:predicted nucleic acid-binding Zn ribbon protein
VSDEPGEEQPGEEQPPEQAPLSGPELARAALDAARARRPAGRRRPAATDPASDGPDGGNAEELRTARGRGWSAPGPDPRDPQPLSAVLGKLVRVRGWEQPAAEARLFALWEQVVGSEVATHCRPTKLEDGELTLEASSTAWATQLRLLAGKLLKQIAADVGHNVVTRLRIHGPAAPSWKRGPRRIRGRGPRDTYG